MRRSFRKFLTVLISGLLIVSYTGTALAEGFTNNNYTITEAYEYPILPGTEEWAEFNTRMEKIEACQIPESILKNMTTKALVETVMNYPLLVDMFVRETKQEAFDAIYRVFNGLQELTSRQDALYELEKYANSLVSSKVSSLSSEEARSKHTVQSGGIEILLYHFNPKIEKRPIAPYAGDYVLTPAGTKVTVYVGYTWESHGMTPMQGEEINKNYQKAYPNATQIRTPNPAYNCHSYAWYSTSSSNKSWMQNSSAYMTDGSYQSTVAAVGCKAYYGKTANHSAIVTGVGGGTGPNIGVRSKWGPFGLYSHKILDCPFAENATVTFWRLS